jgi:hypothetical protein
MERYGRRRHARSCLASRDESLPGYDLYQFSRPCCKRSAPGLPLRRHLRRSPDSRLEEAGESDEIGLPVELDE